jgi:hypothetical protein
MESLLEQTDVIRRKGRKWRKIRNTIFFVLVFGLLTGGGIRYYYPYAEGFKSGELESVVPYKRLIFETYEGKLNQSNSDIKSSSDGSIQSNEFEFSIGKKKLYDELINARCKTVKLHYTEYFGAIPWRGYSRYVVDEIVSISDETSTDEVMENTQQ